MAEHKYDSTVGNDRTRDLCLGCNCQRELSMYNFCIFEGPFDVVITNVRDVALFVGVLSAGQVVLVLQDARLITAPLLTPQ